MSAGETLKRLGITEREFLELAALERKPYSWVGGRVRAEQEWEFLRRIIRPEDDEILLPLMALEPLPGFAATVAEVNGHIVFDFANAAQQEVATSFRVPDGWEGGTLRFRLWLAGSVAAAGNVRLRIECRFSRAGRGMSVGSDAGVEATVALPAVAQEVVEANMDLSLSAAQAGDVLSLRMLRFGADALDTYTGIMRLVGVRLTLV